MHAVLYGHNSLLLLTRARILGLLGVACDIVTAHGELTARLHMAAPDLIILCQTLSKEECDLASKAAGNDAPASPLIVMYTLTPPCVPDWPHVMVPSMMGPVVFSRTVMDLLRERTFGALERSFIT